MTHTQGKTTLKHVSKIPNTYSHSSSTYKSKTKLKNRNPQILDVEYAPNLWIPKLHRNCNEDHFIVLHSVFRHQSWILSNLGWVLARTSTHTQVSIFLFSFFWKIWFFMIFFNLSKYELFWRTHTWKFFFQKVQILNVFLHISFVI